MLPFILFMICTLASAIGAIVGAGGGVIIKPVLDMFNLLPVSAASFSAGCTVLGMAVCSMIRNRADGIKLPMKTNTSLAVGAVFGGLTGKALFEMVRNNWGNEHTLGTVQAILLTLINLAVLVYICKKDRLPSMHVDSIPIAVVIGIVLGIVSSFLGIGGGPYNVAVLFFFFSMNAKEAAKSSLYIIIFSQVSSIASAVLSGSVPDFEPVSLIGMVAGGITGALVGAAISKRLDNSGVERILKTLLVVLIVISFYNILQFTVL